jgi:hypothetical protein
VLEMLRRLLHLLDTYLQSEEVKCDFLMRVKKIDFFSYLIFVCFRIFNMLREKKQTSNNIDHKREKKQC